MGMDLSGEGGYYRFSNVAWGKVLELARQYGWEPAGTMAPPSTVHNADGTVDMELTQGYRKAYANWDGNYHINARQWVTDEDAANIADALERALDDIPDFDTDEKVKEYTPDTPTGDPVLQMLAQMGLGGVGPDDSLSPVEFFSGAAKEKVWGFIAYCRAGGFSIG